MDGYKLSEKDLNYSKMGEKENIEFFACFK